ncbi:protein translocase subunit SecF [Patescibacteria group bacterium]|nr:protein translocase subunit SecF [Patescibacteria group bacterium]
MAKFDVIKLSKVWLGISAVIITAAIASIIVFGLNFGIDFTGGSLLEVQTSQEATLDDVRDIVTSVGYDAIVQESDEHRFLIRTETLTPEEHDQILSAMDDRFESVEEFRFESVGPVIGEELKRKSVLAVILLLVLIVLYVAWAFRKVSKPVASWKYGVLTVIAALHDVLIPLGAFAILGHFIGYQVDTAFVAAILTILGYSINDTIVVFDRTRENLTNLRHSDTTFADIVNRSVVQSFGRSINTSLTTLLVLFAIFFFGGETTQQFILALIIGIVSGAYSSLFIASPLLVMWQKKIRG